MTVLPARSRFFTLVLLCAVCAGFLSALPYVEHVFSPQFRGLTVERDKDYANYDSRLERALRGYPAEASNAITPIGSGIEGLQVAGVEEVMGTLFSWTHLNGPTASVVITAILTPILFVLFYLLFTSLCFPPGWALSMTLLLFGIMFHGLTRVVHPGWSFLPTVGSLLAFFLLFQKPTPLRLLWSIALLGVMPYLYFWSWTFSWAVCGSAVLLSLFSSPAINLPRRSPLFFVLLTVGVLLLAIPFVLQTLSLFGNALYPEVSIRASFLTQRTPESWIRTVLLLLQLAALASLWKQFRTDWSYIAVLSFLLGITLALHQNVLDDRVLMFASHYYPHLLIATTICGAWVLLRRVWMPVRLLVAGIACVFLAAGAYDYAFAQAFFVPRASDFRDQHLIDAVAYLQGQGRATVLTDADTGRVVTSWTDDGIVYTTHARFLFISDADLVERYCVSELFGPQPPVGRVLDYEYNRILQSAAYQAYQKKLVTTICARVQNDPIRYLQKYKVDFVLWNADQRPAWVVSATALHLVPERSGSGWTLWRFIR